MIQTKNIAYFSKVLESIWKERNSYSFVSNIHRIYQNFDDPQIFQYSSTININKIHTDGFKDTIVCTGSSINSEKEALAKCLLESLERKASLTYKKNDFIYSSYSELIKLKKIAIDPLLFSPFSKDQLNQKKYQRFNINKNSIIPWKEACCLINNKKVLIPAELAYFNFISENKIMIPISTGTAAGSTKEDAILRGIYEVIERDAFMVRYLTKTTGIEISTKKTNEYKMINKICDKYRLKIKFIDITIDMIAPTILAILINKSNIGPSVSLGIKTHPNYKEAIKGAFEEALQTRTWIRQHYENENSEKINKINSIRSIEERGMHWYSKEMLTHLTFLMKTIKKKIIKKQKYTNVDLEKIIKEFQKLKKDIYVFDLTPKEYKKIPLFITKVIIPDLQPLYLDEEFPYFGNKRLYQITSNFNKIPHPFL